MAGSRVAALMTDGKARVGVVSVDDGTISSFKARMEGFHMEISERYPEMSVVSQQVMTRDKDQFDFLWQCREWWNAIRKSIFCIW